MKIDKLVGKEVQVYPGDTRQKYGIIEDWNEQGMIIKITKSTCDIYQAGNSYYFSHSSGIRFKII